MVIRVLSIIFTLAGAILLAFALSAYRGTRAFTSAASPAEGVVVETIRRRGTRIGSRPKYYFKIRFQTATGETVEAIPEEGHNSPDYRVGERVPLLYQREPLRAAINEFSTIWFNTALLVALGGYFLAVGLCNLWITARPAPRIRSEVKLQELREALRDGRLRRDSEYQGLLVAFSFVGFALLALVVMVLFFSSTTTKVVFAAALLFLLAQIIRGRRRRSPRSD